MAGNHKMTQNKRARERKQMDRRENKAAKKAHRAIEKSERQALKDQGIDPDLVGIYPGPQPPRND